MYKRYFFHYFICLFNYYVYTCTFLEYLFDRDKFCSFFSLRKNRPYKPFKFNIIKYFNFIYFYVDCVLS